MLVLVSMDKASHLSNSALGGVIRLLDIRCGGPSTPQKLPDILKQGSLPGESPVKNDSSTP